MGEVVPVVRKHRRLLVLTVSAMAGGLVFLVATVGLVAWRLLVGPVPSALAYAAIGLGAITGTAILVSVFLYAATEHREHR